MLRKIFFILILVSFVYSHEFQNLITTKDIKIDKDFEKAQDAYDMQDYKKAMRYLKISANNNNVDAIWLLGFIYDSIMIHKGIQPDYKEAFKWYKKCALLNDEQCLFNIGNMYYNGHGVKQDYKKALKWYEKAAEYDSIDAYYSLGLLYERGLGVKQDYKKALKWYEKAADIDNIESIEKIKELNLKINKN